MQPSGILCKVIDKTSIKVLLILLLLLDINFGNNLSPINKSKPPVIKPIKITKGAIILSFVANSKAGFNSEKKDAAIITPAEKPKVASKIFLFTFLKQNTKAAPLAVTKNVNIPAIKACQTGFNFTNKENINSPYCNLCSLNKLCYYFLIYIINI